MCSFLWAYNCNLILYPLHSRLPVRHEAQAGSCEALIVPISTIRASLFTALSLELSSRRHTLGVSLISGKLRPTSSLRGFLERGAYFLTIDSRLGLGVPPAPGLFLPPHPKPQAVGKTGDRYVDEEFFAASPLWAIVVGTRQARHGLPRQNAAALAHAVGRSKTLVGYLQAHLNHLQAGDYFCILAHVEMNATHHMLLQTMR